MRFQLLFSAIASVIMVSAMVIGAKAYASEHKHAGVEVSDAWARATPGKAKNGAAYLTIRNHGMKDIKLVAASSDRSKKTELHTHIMEGDIAKMRALKDVAITGHGKAVFMPGGHHVMLMGLDAPLKEGEEFTLTLTFEGGMSKKVIVPVKGVGAMKSHGHKHGHGHKHEHEHGKKKEHNH